MKEMAEVKEVKVDALALAEERLLEANGLRLEDVSSTLSQVQTHAVDEADVYFQLRHVESWSLEEGIVKSGAFSIEQGVGVRAIAARFAVRRLPLRWRYWRRIYKRTRKRTVLSWSHSAAAGG